MLVQREPSVERPLAALDAFDDLLCARHLRHALGADEARRLDARQADGGEPVDELRPGCRGQNLLLVLEAVARPYLADRDQDTRSGVIRTSTRRSPGLWLWNFRLPVYFSESLSMCRLASSLSSSSAVPVTVT